MNVFYALGEPTRLNIVELLAVEGKLTATQIANKFSVSAAAISQHLKVLKEARLVKMEKNAQQRIYQIDAQTIEEVENSLKKLRELWDDRFEAIDKIIQAQKTK